MRSRTKVVDFMEYKNNKPFYTKPSIIIAGQSTADTYHVVRNLVYKGKQILAFKKLEESTTIIFAEAIMEDGILKSISKIPDHEIPFLIEQFKMLNAI